jgi:hypothetical protein
MEMNALRGIVKDGAGTTLYNYFTEFGLDQISFDFVFGTAGTNIQGKVRTTLRAIEDNLMAAAMKLSLHRSAVQAQTYYADVEIEDNPTTDLLGD